MGAVSRDRLGRSGWDTAARARGQFPRATSAKSISARSLSPSEISRFRRPMSMSMHSTVFPSRARQEATPPVTVVLPVPPLPEVTVMTVPMEFLLSHQVKSITNPRFVNGFLKKFCMILMVLLKKSRKSSGAMGKSGWLRVTGAAFESWPTGGDSPSGWGPASGWGGPGG